MPVNPAVLFATKTRDMSLYPLIWNTQIKSVTIAIKILVEKSRVTVYNIFD